MGIFGEPRLSLPSMHVDKTSTLYGCFPPSCSFVSVGPSMKSKCVCLPVVRLRQVLLPSHWPQPALWWNWQAILGLSTLLTQLPPSATLPTSFFVWPGNFFIWAPATLVSACRKPDSSLAPYPCPSPVAPTEEYFSKLQKWFWGL